MTTKPIRLQRSRARGFNLISPNGLPMIYVGRPSVLGNPYLVEKFGRSLAIRLFRETCDGSFDPTKFIDVPDPLFHEAMIIRTAWLKSFWARFNMMPAEYIRVYARGMNVVCWCPLQDDCHGDEILQRANA